MTLSSRQRAYQQRRKARAFLRWCEEHPVDRPLSAEELAILRKIEANEWRPTQPCALVTTT